MLSRNDISVATAEYRLYHLSAIVMHFATFESCREISTKTADKKSASASAGLLVAKHLRVSALSESDTSAIDEYSDVSLQDEGEQMVPFSDSDILTPGSVTTRLLPSVQFSVRLMSDVEANTVRVTMKGISNLSSKYNHCVRYQVTLREASGRGHKILLPVKKRLTEPGGIENEFDFVVAKVVAHNLTLRVCVYAKDATEHEIWLVGELLVPCCNVRWTTPERIYSEELNTKLRRKKSGAAKQLVRKLSSSLRPQQQSINRSASWSGSLHQDSTDQAEVVHVEVGQLFILLRYEDNANRINVVIKEAKKLPMLNWLPRRPEYYVSTHLMRNSDTLTTNDTENARGYNPVWNQSFSFRIPNFENQGYWLKFVVWRVALYDRNSDVGEVIQPSGTEAARWHSILSAQTRPRGCQASSLGHLYRSQSHYYPK
ncbi:PREDICTED: uncharacterized protein LOC106818274 isoform X2 [Priapulus caudatus]|uniref:Uncharacterized protein LOC106818274 isoform X2 n=1 Tax=Priapulus caudatus TaxID=37621 RepID=A0ABM1F210_PRICU|nr:PREDICTED: uncharacterized protein LOC106818274 isoform X2 [Priapulus caudatus]